MIVSPPTSQLQVSRRRKDHPAAAFFTCEVAMIGFFLSALPFPKFEATPIGTDYTKAIPPVADEFLNWPGKAEGKPKPPVIWTVGKDQYQNAGPMRGPKPSWDDAPDWAKYLMQDRIYYYWSTDWQPAGYRVEVRP
jgi:hypothetical protein